MTPSLRIAPLRRPGMVVMTIRALGYAFQPFQNTIMDKGDEGMGGNPPHVECDCLVGHPLLFFPMGGPEGLCRMALRISSACFFVMAPVDAAC